MTDHDVRERSDSDVKMTDSETDGWLEAAVGVWPAWLVAAGAVAVAVYFHLTESIWETSAEIFYAEIFAIVAVAAVGYGVYEAHERVTAF